MSKTHLADVNFDIIRYANCWEDADVLLEALSPNSDSKIMSIALAGDNCFSLLSTSPIKVVAVDISMPQLCLTELKKIAIQNFDRATYMAFVGFTASNQRLPLYKKMNSQLSPACLSYWETKQNELEEGIIHCGKFERYFQLFKSSYLHDIHSQETVNELFQEKSAEEQKKFHDTVWHNAAWKKMYGFFFGEQMMGDHGRDPEFLKHVEGSVSDMILAQEVAHLRTARVQQNYFLYYILNNKFDENFLPHYVRVENYQNVQANIDKLILHHGLLDSALEIHGDCNAFNLSDIFEYMDETIFKKVAEEIILSFVITTDQEKYYQMQL